MIGKNPMLKMPVACLTAVSSLPPETPCFQPAPRADLAFEVISQSPPPMTSGDTAYLYTLRGRRLPERDQPEGRLPRFRTVPVR